MTLDIDTFADGYIDCILWCDAVPATCNPDHPDYDDGAWEQGGLTGMEVPADVRAIIIERAMIVEFVEANAADLALYCEAMGPWHGSDDRGYCEDPAMARAGHDFYLTRARHGAGFWDRGLGALGERLSEAARSYGSPDDHMVYENADGTASV